MGEHMTQCSYVGGEPDAVHTRRGYLVISMGKVLCYRLDVFSCAGQPCGCTYLGLQRATTGQGPFQRL